jgi:hypothetical protein
MVKPKLNLVGNFNGYLLANFNGSTLAKFSAKFNG